jgi:transcriptional regulator with XRE-family HTH domain
MAFNKKLRDQHLLHLHRLHDGLYARVADIVGVDPSYVSRVARGERVSERVSVALLSQLASIEKQRQRFLR